MEKLKQMLDFTEDDLIANRRGELTPQQHNILNKTIYKKEALSGVAMPIISIWIAGYIIMKNFTGTLNTLIVIMMGLTFVAMLFVLLFADYVIRIKKDDRDGKAATVSGKADLIYTVSKAGHRYVTLQLKEEKIILDPRTYPAFIKGEYYRIYYAPRSKYIFSAESLSSIKDIEETANS